jgi:hypothetical protein
MMRRAATLLVLSSLLALGCKRPQVGTDAGEGTAPRAAASPSAPPAPAMDLSGKWECLWNVAGGSGSETWMLIQEGEAVRVTLSGKDPGGRYTGAMTGAFRNSRLDLTFKYHDNTQGSMTLKASANGKILDGDSTRATSKVVSHYGCSRS